MQPFTCQLSVKAHHAMTALLNMCWLFIGAYNANFEVYDTVWSKSRWHLFAQNLYFDCLVLALCNLSYVNLKRQLEEDSLKRGIYDFVIVGYWCQVYCSWAPNHSALVTAAGQFELYHVHNSWVIVLNAQHGFNGAKVAKACWARSQGPSQSCCLCKI